MSRVSLEDKMISEAEFGLFYFYGILTKKKVSELEKMGFRVVDSHEKKTYPRLHKVLWVHAKVDDVDYNDLKSLNEKDSKYTFPQKLWIISMKNKRIG